MFKHSTRITSFRSTFVILTLFFYKRPKEQNARSSYGEQSSFELLYAYCGGNLFLPSHDVVTIFSGTYNSAT